MQARQKRTPDRSRRGSNTSSTTSLYRQKNRKDDDHNSKCAPTNTGASMSHQHTGVAHPGKKRSDHKKDEDILIEFMGHLRRGEIQAVEIHSKFGTDASIFVHKAREYLQKKKNNSNNELSVDNPIITNYDSHTDSKTQTTKLKTEDHLVSQLNTSLVLESNLSNDKQCNSVEEEPSEKGVSMDSTHPSLRNPVQQGSQNDDTLNATAKIIGTIPSVVNKFQPKRLLLRHADQPGRVYALSTSRGAIQNRDHSSFDRSHDGTLMLPPKAEITASWQLPLEYIRKRALEIATIQEKIIKSSSINDIRSMTIQSALASLTIGLFRRGCAENGSKNAIIAKQIVCTNNSEDGTTRPNSLSDAMQLLQHYEQHHGEVTQVKKEDKTQYATNIETFPYSVNHELGIIHGTVPFFAPRTPGNVILRLYFEDDPIYTLATSQCISVCITPDTLQPTIAFILSNFRNQKGSGINFSSMHSLASVLEQVKSLGHNVRIDPTAGQKVWGAICESKKIVDAARRDYMKKFKQLETQEKELELAKVLEDAENENHSPSDEKDQDKMEQVEENQEEGSEEKESDQKITSAPKMKIWQHQMEKSSNERKWREVQLAYASILQSVVSNKVNIHKLLKPDHIKNIRLEYELWCIWCESFAPSPFEKVNDDDEKGSFLQLKTPYHSISEQDFEACQKSKMKMQKDTFGFILFQEPIDGTKAKGLLSSLLHSLSAAIADQFKSDFLSPDSNDIMKKKMEAQAIAQKAVDSCHLLESGTKVVIFGSSANGFGSPHSDLDMCLQLPDGVHMNDEESVQAMTLLAEKLTELGMVDVDTGRLTARVPVIKFYAKVDDTLIECDISKANKLACMNTHLLRCYATISPVVRALASVIKRWAKSRNINDPSHRTLSSYGYILLLLHFLTTHSVNTNGNCVSMLNDEESNELNSKPPLVPNLQWVNVNWTMNHHPEEASYAEILQKPRAIMPHPTEPSYMVNSHFLNVIDDSASTLLGNLQRYSELCLPPSSLGKLLASFFYYYAYQFDYKKHVVSLNATARRGHVYREDKAEYDGWKVFGTSLGIEDPFEEFYDVAHVLTPMNFLRIKREFAHAYTKIIEMALSKEREVQKKKLSSSTMNNIITKEDGVSLLDWICEKVEKEG